MTTPLSPGQVFLSGNKIPDGRMYLFITNISRGVVWYNVVVIVADQVSYIHYDQKWQQAGFLLDGDMLITDPNIINMVTMVMV